MSTYSQEYKTKISLRHFVSIRFCYFYSSFPYNVKTTFNSDPLQAIIIPESQLLLTNGF